jgi:hypothetical protein
LHGAATPSDAALVSRALVLVQREQAERLRALRAGVSAGWTHDSAVAEIAAAEKSALAAQIADLRRPGVRVSWSSTTQGAIDDVQDLLTAGRRRFGVAAPARPAPARLNAADPTLARLGRLVDTPLPDRMLVAAGSGAARQVRVIDLRHDAVRRLPAPIASVLRHEVNIVAAKPLGRGSVVVQTRTGAVYAIARAMTGQPRRIGRGAVLPAVTPGAVWLYGFGRKAGLIEVSTTGRRLAGPFPAPRFALTQFPAGLTVPAGLVISGTAFPGTPSVVPTGIWLWDPRLGPVLRPLAKGCAEPLATHATLLAWLRCDRRNPAHTVLKITDTATGRTRTIAGPRRAVPALTDIPTASAFSPDGKRLAYYCVGTGFGGYALAVANVASGTSTLVRRPPIDAVGDGFSSALAHVDWAPDSRRVFYTTGASGVGTGQASVPFAFYQVSTGRADNIRFRARPAMLLALLD